MSSSSSTNDDFDFVPVMAPTASSSTLHHQPSTSSSTSSATHNTRNSLFMQRGGSSQSKGKTSPKQPTSTEYIIDSRLPDNSRQITPPQPARSRHSFVPVLNDDDDDIFEAPPSPTHEDITNYHPVDEKKRPPSIDKSNSYRSRRTVEHTQPMEFDDQDDFFENPLPHFAGAIALSDVPSSKDDKRRSIRAVALNLDEDDILDEKKGSSKKWGDMTLSRGLARNQSVRWQWARPDANGGDLKSNNLRAFAESSAPRTALSVVYAFLILFSGVALGLSSTHVSRATYAPADSEASYIVTAVTADVLLTTIVSALSVVIASTLFGTSLFALRRRARLNRRTFVGPTATRSLVRQTLIGATAIVFMVGVWCAVSAVSGVQSYNCGAVRNYKAMMGDSMADDYPVVVSPGHAMSMATCRINDSFLAFAVLGALGWVAALVLFVAHKTNKLASFVSLGATIVLAS